jgi:hypothetical protein
MVIIFIAILMMIITEDQQVISATRTPNVSNNDFWRPPSSKREEKLTQINHNDAPNSRRDNHAERPCFWADELNGDKHCTRVYHGTSQVKSLVDDRGMDVTAWSQNWKLRMTRGGCWQDTMLVLDIELLFVLHISLILAISKYPNTPCHHSIF